MSRDWLKEIQNIVQEIYDLQDKIIQSRTDDSDNQSPIHPKIILAHLQSRRLWFQRAQMLRKRLALMLHRPPISYQLQTISPDQTSVHRQKYASCRQIAKLFDTHFFVF